MSAGTGRDADPARRAPADTPSSSQPGTPARAAGPSRRGLLTAASLAPAAALALGGAGLSACTSGSPWPAPTPLVGPRRYRKAVKLGMVQVQGSLTERFQLLAELGFDGVEPDSPGELTTDEVLAAREASGLEIPGVVCSTHWSQPLSHPDPAVRAAGRAGLEQALRDAAAWGASTVLLVPAVVSKQVAYDQAWQRSLAELRRVVPLAEELGVAIALENVWNSFLLSPLEARDYVDACESDQVGIHFDVGNVVNHGWPEQWVAILGRRILKLDIKEYSRKRRNDEGLWKGFDVKLLEGDCDWPAVMAALDAIGYSGWMTAELSGGNRAWLADVAARMDRIIAS